MCDGVLHVADRGIGMHETGFLNDVQLSVNGS